MPEPTEMELRLAGENARLETVLRRLIVCADEVQRVADYTHGDGDDVRLDVWKAALQSALDDARQATGPKGEA